ncbi:DUF6559 family protein [Caulobacter sp. 17J65-9]|uniref:DUF6559 family protein n=1 Tax=Caulobacter sp. 17J65-9 TaxID=2709382 RepID=UPI0013C70CE3|nr:DUF6559 family protein [Caulobacter sp. 17J65-9]NEX92802.1 hypothetical protein [Caulobacter sp. 17J65-9]
MFGWFMRRRAISRYRTRLPGLLRRDYGSARNCTPAQVRATIGRYGLSDTYASFAVAMFADRKAFDADQKARAEAGDYNRMRGEVSAACFGGADFTIADLSSAQAHGHGHDGGDGHGGHGGHGGHDTGHGGGDGGGHH